MKAYVECKCLEDGCTPLMESASVNSVQLVRLLLSYGANINAVSNNG